MDRRHREAGLLPDRVSRRRRARRPVDPDRADPGDQAAAEGRLDRRPEPLGRDRRAARDSRRPPRRGGLAAAQTAGGRGDRGPRRGRACGRSRMPRSPRRRAAAAKKKLAEAAKKGAPDDVLRQLVNEANPQGEVAKPTAKRYMVNDATVEKLGELLRENPRGLLYFRDELTGLLPVDGPPGARVRPGLLPGVLAGDGLLHLRPDRPGDDPHPRASACRSSARSSRARWPATSRGRRPGRMRTVSCRGSRS